MNDSSENDKRLDCAPILELWHSTRQHASEKSLHQFGPVNHFRTRRGQIGLHRIEIILTELLERAKIINT